MSWVAMLPRELGGQLAAHVAWLHQQKVGDHVMAAVTMIISKGGKKALRNEAWEPERWLSS